MEQIRRELFAEAPRGVVRMHVRADDSNGNVDVLETKINGLNEELVAQLGRIDSPIGELGMTLFAHGTTFAHLPEPNGYMEVGQNSTGAITAEYDTFGETWLSYYSQGQRADQDEQGDPIRFTGLAEAGAAKLMQEYIGSQRFADLGWENNVDHATDGQPQHG